MAGIEPASEGLQQTEPTCVSGSLSFATTPFEPGKCGAPLAPLVSAGVPGLERQPSLLVASRPDLAGKIGET